jgi:hypothetical protein
MKRTKKLQLALVVIAATQMGATDCGQVLRDPGFDLWCGDELCSWKLLRGDIEQVGTWHESDSGVSFVGADSAIQQVAPVNSGDGSCIRFTMVADVQPGAEVFLDIDLEADGTVERPERVVAANWAPVEIFIKIDGPYDGIRFELRKTGNGRAVLANIGAEIAGGECGDIAPIVVAPRPDGGTCFEDEHCASGICAQSPTQVPGSAVFGFACAGCDVTAICNGGDVCGLAEPTSPLLAVPVACVPPAVKELAEQCILDAECASGICGKPSGGALGLCSACATASDCGGGACDLAWTANTFPSSPKVCRPGEGAGTTGVACGTDADCASGTCAGSERKTCEDGRECRTPADCPATDGLAPGPCTTVGVQGGTCT